MIKKLLLLFVLLVIIAAGAVYFWIWPTAQQYLASMGAILQQPYGNVEELLPVLPVEEVGLGIDQILSVLPILRKIGADGLRQIQELAANGFTAEEAQQILKMLQDKLSAVEISQLQELFKTQ